MCLLEVVISSRYMLTMTHPQIYALENTFADPLIVIQQELSFQVSSCSCISSHYNLS